MTSAACRPFGASAVLSQRGIPARRSPTVVRTANVTDHTMLNSITFTPTLLGSIAVAVVAAVALRDEIQAKLSENVGALIYYGGISAVAFVLGREAAVTFGSTPGEWVSTLLDGITGALPI